MLPSPTVSYQCVSLFIKRNKHPCKTPLYCGLINLHYKFVNRGGKFANLEIERKITIKINNCWSGHNGFIMAILLNVQSAYCQWMITKLASSDKREINFKYIKQYQLNQLLLVDSRFMISLSNNYHIFDQTKSINLTFGWRLLKIFLSWVWETFIVDSM